MATSAIPEYVALFQYLNEMFGPHFLSNLTEYDGVKGTIFSTSLIEVTSLSLPGRTV